MKYIKCRWLLAMIMSCSLFSCTNLDEEVFDRVDAGIYYQDETSVQGAVAAIYSKAAYSYLEYFWYLQEFSADQVAWRSWNGGLWGCLLCLHIPGRQNQPLFAKLGRMRGPLLGFAIRLLQICRQSAPHLYA